MGAPNGVAPIIAWAGQVELLGASWSLTSGHTVEVRLCEEEDERVHPFRHLKRRRGTKPGTIFHATMAREGQEACFYDDKVQLAAWADGDRGQTVRFFLPKEGEASPFTGFQPRQGRQTPGEIFTLALVEVDTDGSPIDQQKSDRVTQAQPPPKEARKQRKPRTLSSQLHLMVTSEMFVQFLREKVPRDKKGRLITWTAEKARVWVKHVCKMESLAEVDRSAAAAALFREKIQKPYAAWNPENRGE